MVVFVPDREWMIEINEHKWKFCPVVGAFRDILMVQSDHKEAQNDH